MVLNADSEVSLTRLVHWDGPRRGRVFEIRGASEQVFAAGKAQ
jgi:hypothetical protein